MYEMLDAHFLNVFSLLNYLKFETNRQEAS
jgi:hypothetical protein